ncbi:hypothetical protein C8Q79DRAFT_461022 [Trametes meyenii]|nr:hypothetical protein C8Q79DRAFT_461022 [Trametes meyenii]
MSARAWCWSLSTRVHASTPSSFLRGTRLLGHSGGYSGMLCRVCRGPLRAAFWFGRRTAVRSRPLSMYRHSGQHRPRPSHLSHADAVNVHGLRRFSDERSESESPLLYGGDCRRGEDAEALRHPDGRSVRRWAHSRGHSGAFSPTTMWTLVHVGAPLRGFFEYHLCHCALGNVLAGRTRAEVKSCTPTKMRTNRTRDG